MTAHEALFRLTEAEQVIKNSELSLERVLADADLKRALGKLRYLKTIAAARKRAAAAAAAGGTSADRKGDAMTGSAGQQQLQQKQTGAGTEATGKPSPRAAAAAAALQRAAAAAGDDRDATIAAEDVDEQQEQQLEPGAAAAAVSDDAITQDSCPICHDKVEAAAAVLPCGHVLCCSCADGLTARIPAAVPQPQRRINCPTCRARTHVSDVAYVDSGRGSTYAYVSTESTRPAAGDGMASLGSPRRRSSDAGASSSNSKPNGGYCWQGEQQLIVSGSYGIKIEALLRRLLFIMQQDVSNKVIVFSSWQDGLDIVSHALRANGVSHAYGRGRKGFLKALEQFKGSKVDEAEAVGTTAAAGIDTGPEQEGDPPDQHGSQVEPQQQRQQHEESTKAASPSAGPSSSPGIRRRNSGSSHGTAGPRVLLLLVQQGAAGLNLTEAQHVVLLEPLLDPAQELQAMGRVNRFGQTRTTHVHR